MSALLLALCLRLTETKKASDVEPYQRLALLLLALLGRLSYVLLGVILWLHKAALKYELCIFSLKSMVAG